MRRKYNSDGLSSDNAFPVAPVGDYSLIIRDVKDTKDGVQWKTRNGDDYVQVKCEVDEGDYLGVKVWHGVTFMDDKARPGAGMSLKFLKAIGEPHEGAFDIDTDAWVGKRFRARLKIAKDLNGNDKNEIGWLIDSEAAKSDDEVPF